MYFAVYKYGDNLAIDESYPIESTDMYVLDTDDWTVELVRAIDIFNYGIEIWNLYVAGNMFSFSESNIVASLEHENELSVKRSKHAIQFTVRINGVDINILLASEDNGNKDDHSTQTLFINNKDTVSVRGSIELTYAFTFKEYIVLRFVLWVYEGDSSTRWHSVAIGKDGTVHYWDRTGGSKDGVGSMIDMLSEV